MLKSAEAKDKKAVLKINKSLEPLILKEQKNYNTILGLDYDNCRQSCVLPFTFLPNSYDLLMTDAREKFSKLKNRY